ncbi:DUF1932 domain-containing protein [Actinomadura keratinilytica]|jgi:3-hydroxyisobutyrate dehydrogenase-like beta-hydroxyacid dehydrogenase|uniref:NAD(P)-dependent oxidoreductase n=2 Tax=Actinomadura keratinilytica TaxID=547461 RepID=A0ABP7ZCH8_9ACTN
MTVTVAVLGLGEAGGEIARDLLAAGAHVRGYDPAVRPGPGIRACADEADAAAGADLVLSVNSAHDAEDALRAGLPGLAADAVWADLNTASPGLKRTLAELAGPRFADVALMAPVPGKGLRTPMLASGPAAAGCAELLRPLGASVTVLDGDAGEAATRKLLRSVFFKGMAAAVTEALHAAREAGLEDWLRDNIGAELAAADASLVRRLEEGSVKHAVRRSAEMRAAARLLAELGVPSRISDASRRWLDQLASSTESSTINAGTVRSERGKGKGDGTG